MFEVNNLNNIITHLRNNPDITFNITVEPVIVNDNPFKFIIERIKNTQIEGISTFDQSIEITCGEHTYKLFITVTCNIYYRKFFFFRKKNIVNYKLVILNYIDGKFTTTRTTELKNMESRFNRITKLINHLKSKKN